jgi:hypothetical protein
MRRALGIAAVAALSTGCAIGAHAGVGLTVDTTGAVGVEVRAGWNGSGWTSNERRGDEIALYLLSVEGAVGYESRRGPHATIAPGVGLGGQPGSASGLGWHANLSLALGADGAGAFIAGPSLRLSLLPVAAFATGPPPDSRPEWSPTNTYHSLGVTLATTLFLSEADPYARFYLGPEYQFTEYTSMGL